MQNALKLIHQDALAPESIAARCHQLNADGYESLVAVLTRALFQAAHGKGRERHAQDTPFHTQPMQQLIQLYGPGFALGQAAKKAQESQRMPTDRAVAELLGAINYLAGAVIALEKSAPLPVQEAANDAAEVRDPSWIDWAGGECPVTPRTNVELRMRGFDGISTGWAMHFHWHYNGADDDIVAYRVLPDVAEAA